MAPCLSYTSTSTYCYLSGYTGATVYLYVSNQDGEQRDMMGFWEWEIFSLGYLVCGGCRGGGSRVG